MNTTNVSTLFPQLVISRTRQPFITTRANDFPKAESVSSRLYPSTAYERRDLASLLRLVTWIFQPLARSKQLSLIVDAPVAGLVAMCDDVRIQRVLETLLTHAVNFSPPESKILLSARLEGDWLRFSVTDEGPGISPDELEATFEANDNPLVRFVAEDAGVDNEMAACRRIVTAHGGKIKTSNLPEGGTLFEFAIPAAMSHRAGQSSNVA